MKAALEAGREGEILTFDDSTGRVIDFVIVREKHGLCIDTRGRNSPRFVCVLVTSNHCDGCKHDDQKIFHGVCTFRFTVY